MVAPTPRHEANRASRSRVRPADRGEIGDQLAAPQRHRDFLIATRENYLAILDRLDGDLIGLVSDLQSEDLSFVHHLAVDDRIAAGRIDGDRANQECRWRNFGTSL